MASTSVTVRMDETLKKQAETLFDDMGLNMTTAVTLFVKAAVKQNKIPFEITGDPYFDEGNMKFIRKAIADLNAGRNVVYKTMDELLAMENE